MDRFVFFGGKGGVGKTTISCAYGRKCAAAGLDTLVVSTDPAHSTEDVFEQAIGDEPVRVEGHDHLWALEIDPAEEVERHAQEVRRRMGEQVSPAIVNELDRQIELSHRTPGAYEAALFDRVIEVLREADDWDRVVFDTAPTGGTLRLLALPEHLGAWIDRLIDKRLASIDLFEKAAVGGKEARRRAEEDPIVAHLREREERFEFAGRIFREESAFDLVVNPDDLSIGETRRTVEAMGEHGLAVDGLVVNRVTPEPDEDEEGRGASYLRERVASERERIERIRREFDVPVLAVVESRASEVTGDRLADVADELDVPVTPESVEA